MKRHHFTGFAGVLALGLGLGVALSRTGISEGAQSSQPEVEKLSASIAFFEQRLHADPENSPAASHLVDRYLLRFQLGAELADLERAEEVARVLLKLTPNRADAFARLSGVHLTQHEFADALTAAEAALRADSTSEAALGALFDAAMAAGRYDRAEAALRQVNTKTVPGRVRLAHWLTATGETDGAYHHLSRACDTLERAGARGQALAWCLAELAGVQVGREGPRAVRTLYQQALQAQPGYRGAVEGLANLAHARGDWKEADRLYSRIATDTHPDIYLRLAEASRGQGQEDRARRYEERFLRVATAPGAEALNAIPLAIFYARSTRTLDAGLQVARREVARRPIVESYDVLAWVHYRRGEFREALAASDQARRWGSPSPTMDYHRALILEHVGRDEEARRLRKNAMHRKDLLEPHLRVRSPARG